MNIATCDFLKLFFDEDEEIRFRAFPPKGVDGPAIKRQGPIHALLNGSGLRGALKAVNISHGVYFVVNAGGDSDSEITRFNACFAESDTHTIPEQHAKLDACPLATTARVETSRSVHAYWKLHGGVDSEAWREVQRRLIACLDGDKSIKNESRVMRVPGFDHISKDLKRTPVRVVQFNPERVYTISELLAAFPPSETETSRRREVLSSKRNKGGVDAPLPGSFATWDALRAELGRRIMAHETARQNAAGNWDCRGICHDGEGNTGLFYVPATNQAHCNSNCEQATILRAFGFPEQPEQQRTTENSVATKPKKIEPITKPDEEKTPKVVVQEEPRAYTSVTPDESFVTKYVQYASQRTDAPQEAHELMSIGVLSALAGPRPRLPIATNINGWNLCLWMIYIVNSTVGRKTTLINYAIDFVCEILGHDAMLSWEGSPQGIIQRLQGRDGQSAVFTRDEYSGLLGQMNRAGGHMAGLEQLFIRAYDGGTIENIRTKKKNKQGIYEDDTDRVNQPYLVKLCASTWDSFATRATIDNVLNGFLARFIALTGSSVPQAMKLSTQQLTTLRLELIEQARAFHQKAIMIDNLGIDPDVLKLQWELECKWLKRAGECSRPDAAGPALKRLAESVLKVAALLAIDSAVKGEVPQVTIIHFAQAQLMADRWLPSTIALIDALGRTSFQRDCEAVLATIQASPSGMRVHALYRKHRKLRKRDFDEILSGLQTQDEIEIHEEKENKKGPAFRWVIATVREAE